MCVCYIAQLCLILSDPLDYSPPGSSVHEFSKQEYRSGLPFPYSGYLPDPGIKHDSPALAGRFFTNEPPEKKNTYLVSKCFLCTYDVPGSYFRHLSPVNEHNRSIDSMSIDFMEHRLLNERQTIDSKKTK